MRSTVSGRNSSRVTGVRSVQDSHLGWFPSGLPAAQPSEEPRLKSDPWASGVLLSELVSLLLVDDRSSVKEVEQFDDVGRLVGPPKLLLNGTHADVKSRAQAIHNFRLCVRALERVPNFPHVGCSAEDLAASAAARQSLLRAIATVFQLPPLDGASVEPPRQLARLKRALARRSSSAPPRLLQQQFPHLRRSADAAVAVGAASSPLRRRSAAGSSLADPQLLQRNTATNRQATRPPRRSESPAPSRGRSRSASPSRGGDSSRRSSRSGSPAAPARQAPSYFKALDTPPRWRPPPAARVVCDEAARPWQPSQLRGRAPGSPAQRRGRSATPTRRLRSTAASTAADSAADALRRSRAVEMRRERLAVQQRDRRARHSRLVVAHRDATRRRDLQQHVGFSDNDRSAAASAADRDERASRATRFGDDALRSGGHVARARSVASFASTLKTTRTAAGRPLPQRRRRQRAQPALDDADGRRGRRLGPPPPSAAELEAARQTPLEPVTPTQQSAVRDWLSAVGVSLLDGEGGGFWQRDARAEQALHAPPAATATAAQLPQLLQRQRGRPASLPTSRAAVAKALWLWRLRACPPLAPHWFARADGVVAGDGRVVWGLLAQLRQLYAADAADTAADGAALKPLPFHAPLGAGPASVASGGGASGSVGGGRGRRRRRRRGASFATGLGYSPAQRRALDQSLLDWLQRAGLLQETLGAFAGRRPASLLALQSYLRDGTLLFRVAQLLRLPALPPAVPHRRPHSFAQCVANVAVVLDALRRCRDMPRRFLVAPPAPGGGDAVAEAICRGAWDATLGLLEDCHVLHDHRARADNADGSRRLCVARVAYPFLGRQRRAEERALQLQLAPDDELDAEAVPADGDGGGGSSGRPLETPPQPPAPTTTATMRRSSARGARAERRAAPSDAPRSADRRSRRYSPPSASPAASSDGDSDDDAATDSDGSVDLLRRYGDAAVAARRSATPPPAAAALLQLPPREAAALCDALEAAAGGDATLGRLFQDGVWLGRLVQRLERCELAGFVLRPVYPAQRWQNVRRALEALAERNRRLPLRLLSCEDAVAQGDDPAALLALLQTLRRAYAHHKI
eukprot:gene16559-11846_t